MPTLILALIALLTFTMLPGVALIRRHRPVVEQVGGAVALSTALNSFVVMLLVLFKTYTLLAGWLWFSVLLGITLVMSRERSWIHSRFRLPELKKRQAASSALLVPVLAIVAYKSFALPFFAWDSIASWNRWARAFALESDFFSRTEFFHPQYLSWGMSFPYVLSGDITQEPAAHGFAFFCLLILWTGVWRLSSCFSVPGALSCTAVMVPLAVSSYAGTGYSDIAASGFSCLAVALILEAFKTAPMEHSSLQRWPARNRSILAGLAAGTAFHYKLLAPLLFFVLLLGLVVLPGRRGLAQRCLLAFLSGLSSFLVVAPWIFSGNTSLTPPLFHYVTTGIHGDISRLEIILKGATTFLAGTTAFDIPLIDAYVLTGASICFIVALMKSFQAVALGTAVLLGSAVWMSTANYDTRALMPFQTAGVVLSLAGLALLLDRLRGRRLRSSILLSLQSTLLLAYLIPQLAPDLRLGTERAIDWKPGSKWLQTLGLSRRQEKLRVLRPALADLANWIRDHARFSGTFWSDTVLVASFDPPKAGAMARWLGLIESEGQVNWKVGDFLVVTGQESQEPKLPFPIIDEMVGLSPATWGPWIEAAVEAGVLREEGTYVALSSFQFVVEPPPGQTP